MPVNLNDPVDNFGPRPHMEIKSKSKIWTYLSVVALVAALGISLSQVTQRQTIHTSASGGVILSMIKSKPNLQKGDEFSVDILLDARDSQATNADIYLVYPNDILQAEEVTPTNFLPNVIEPPAVGNGSVLIRVSSTAAQKGGGILASLKFKAMQSGNPTINFTNETIVTDQTQKGQVTNLLDKAIGLQFEVK